jgi:hypothetical protein
VSCEGSIVDYMASRRCLLVMYPTVTVHGTASASSQAEEASRLFAAAMPCAELGVRPW